MEGFDPASLGFTLEATRNKGNEAAGSGVDFSELFGGLSFFLLVAGILLTVLLFLLNLESRAGQLRTLVVMGIPVRMIRRIMLAESMLVALAGALAGLGLAILYNRLVFMALNGVWKDVVRTEMMHMDIRISTLLTGLVISLVISFLALCFPLNRKLKRQFRAHQREAGLTRSKPGSPPDGMLAAGFILPALSALGLIGSQLIRMEGGQCPAFFCSRGIAAGLGRTFFHLVPWTNAATFGGKACDCPG